jgi:SagB-type dehydrogenase family enzyme
VARKVTSRGPRLRRATPLVAHWKKDQLIFENYFTRDRVIAAPLTLLVLDFFSRWRHPSEFCSRFNNYAGASLARALRQLTQCHFLLREGSLEARRDASLEKVWAPWLPAAGMLQFETRDVHYESNLAVVRRKFQQHAREIAPPSPVKHYRAAPQFQLPAPQQSGVFPQVLLARRTWRRFTNRPLQLSDLATLLNLTWGVHRWVKLSGAGRLALKTSPSAGARHPIEVYVLAVNVAGLRPGLYHYAADRHRLELLKRGATSRHVVNFLGNQWWYRPAAALMLMTAVFPRNQWKYRDAAAYRTVMIDAGHVCQTFCLVATWLSLAPFCTMAFDQALVEKELGIDGIKESIIYVAGVGARPRGVDWAPWPHPRAWAGFTGS